MGVNERLRHLRTALGLSQKEFGERIGKALRTIQYWEAGEFQIPDTALRHISQVFGVSYEWLKEGKGEMWRKETVGERIRYIRNLLGLTQKEFAQKIGITQGFLTNVEKGRYQPSEKVLRLISQTFGVSLEWLKTGMGELWKKGETTFEGVIELGQRKLLEDMLRVPVIEKVGENFPHNPVDVEVVGLVFVRKSPHLKENKTFAVQVHGDAMYPTLAEGDYVVFRIYDGELSAIPSGKVVVAKTHNGKLLVRRLLKENDTVLLACDNTKYPPISLQGEESLQVVGLTSKILLVREFVV